MLKKKETLILLKEVYDKVPRKVIWWVVTKKVYHMCGSLQDIFVYSSLEYDKNAFHLSQLVAQNGQVGSGTLCPPPHAYPP